MLGCKSGPIRAATSWNFHPTWLRTWVPTLETWEHHSHKSMLVVCLHFSPKLLHYGDIRTPGSRLNCSHNKPVYNRPVHNISVHGRPVHDRPVMSRSVMNMVIFELVCYECGLLWTGLLCIGLLWTWSVMNWSVMNVVCDERVCYE